MGLTIIPITFGAGFLSNEPVYNLPVPAQTISFNLTAVSGNNPPTAPTIAGPTIGDPNVLHPFTFTATDPDNDTIRYGIDWNNDNLVDQLVPSSGYVNSGTSQPGTRLWPANGTYTFKARTEDSKGGTSGWTSHTITIANSCNIGIIGNCGVAQTPSGGTSGTCTLSGSCNYSCNNGTWSMNNNSCAVPKCNDGIDNDSPLDGFKDYGSGPLNDVGCTSIIDDDESNPLTPPVLTANTYVVDPGATGKPVDLIWNSEALPGQDALRRVGHDQRSRTISELRVLGEEDLNAPSTRGAQTGNCCPPPAPTRNSDCQRGERPDALGQQRAHCARLQPLRDVIANQRFGRRQ